MAELAVAIPYLAAAGSVASVASAVGAFGGRKSAAPPAFEKSAVMPTPDDEAIKRARQRSIAAQLSRSGRQSTILSQPDSEFLGA